MLLDDPALRKRMGDAGRAETVKWDWKAATSVLRNVQYTKAEERFNEHRGGGNLRLADLATPLNVRAFRKNLRRQRYGCRAHGGAPTNEP